MRGAVSMSWMQAKIRAGAWCAVVAALMGVFAAGCASKARKAATARVADGAIKIGEKFALQSKVLNEERPYWVYLPQSYHNQMFAPKKHPVLYLLDGDANFHLASGIVQFMAANFHIQIPELIIVAIPNTERTRDLTPTHST